MDSDTDMFDTQIPPTPTQTQKSNVRKAAVSFGYIILFHWSHEISKPFMIYNTHDFNESEIRDSWIENILSAKWRKRKLKPIPMLKNIKVSLFGKLESGIFVTYLRYIYFILYI